MEKGREGVAARCTALPCRRPTAPLPARTKHSTDSVWTDSVPIDDVLRRVGREKRWRFRLNAWRGLRGRGASEGLEVRLKFHPTP